MALNRNRFALGSYQYVRYPLTYFLDTAVQLEVSNVELWAAAPHLYLEQMTGQQLRELKAQLRARQLHVCCITPEQCTYPVNLAAEDEDLRQYSVRSFQRAVIAAQALECPCVLVSAGSGYFNRPAKEAWLRSVDSLTQVARFAQPRGVRLVLETLTPPSSNLLNTPAQLKNMIEQLPAGCVQTMVDIGQMVYMQQTLEDYLELGALLSHVHLHDSHPAIHMALGDGDLPLEEYIHQLEAWGYQGLYAFEFNDRRYYQAPDQADRQSVAWLRQRGLF